MALPLYAFRRLVVFVEAFIKRLALVVNAIAKGVAGTGVFAVGALPGTIGHGVARHYIKGIG